MAVVMAEYMSLRVAMVTRGAEGGGVHAMIGVEHVAQVERAFGLVRGLLAIDHVKEVRGLAQGRIGMDQPLALAMAVKVGGDHRDLRDEPQGLAPLRVLRIVVARRVEAAEARTPRCGGRASGGVSRGNSG
jgi:hypothetical protein